VHGASGVIGDATFCFYDNALDLFAWIVTVILLDADTVSRMSTSDARALRTPGRSGSAACWHVALTYRAKDFDVAHNDTGGCAP